MTLLLGIVGQKKAGKDTLARVGKELYQTAHIHGFSDVLSETAALWGKPNSRRTLQRIAVAMRDVFEEPAALTNVVRLRVEKSMRGQPPFVVIPGIRWETDYEFLRSFQNNMLVSVTATPEIRFKRTIRDTQKAGESKTTWEQFIEEEKASNEMLIQQIGARADATIENNFKILEEYETAARMFFKNVIAPRLLEN